MLNNSRNQSVGRFESRAKSRPRPQRGSRSNFVCHQEKLQLLQGHEDLEMTKRNWACEPSRDRNGDPGMMDVMKMIGAFTNCLESFTRRFESPNSHTQSYKEITPNASDVWVKKGTHA